MNRMGMRSMKCNICCFIIWISSGICLSGFKEDSYDKVILGLIMYAIAITFINYLF